MRLFNSIRAGVMASVLIVGNVQAEDYQDIINALDEDNTPLAEELYQALGNQQQDSFVGKTIKSRLMLGADKYDEAEEFLESLVENYPDEAEAHYLYGATNLSQAQRASIFSKLGYAETGLEHLLKAVQLNPEHVKAHSVLVQFYQHAPSMAGGDTKKAKIHAETLKSLDPEQGFLSLASLAANEEDEKAALAVLQDGLQELPKSSLLHFQTALLSQQLEQWEDASVALDNAVKHADSEKEMIQAKYQIGRNSVMSKSKLDIGLAAMKEVLDTPTSDQHISVDWAHFRTAEIYLQKGDKDSAREHYQLAKNMTGDSELKSRLKKFKRKIK